MVAAVGWAVIPVIGKQPLPRSSWPTEASFDQQKIQNWPRRPNGSNWALPLADHCTVIDVDPKHGGDPAAVIAEFGLQDHPIVWTGEHEGVRGAHIYCAPGTPTGKSTIEGVEIRGA